MELRDEKLDDAITKAVAIGRWDVGGAMEIELRLSVLAGSGRSLVIDMSEVSFLSSMGIRSIVMSAKAVALRGARLVLVSPTEHVAAVLVATGIDTVVPICHDLQVACAIARAGSDPAA